MNQRFRELAQQAETKEIGYYFFDREKFAQLIVVECSTWVNDNVGLMTAEARTDLLKHFGVKE